MRKEVVGIISLILAAILVLTIVNPDIRFSPREEVKCQLNVPADGVYKAHYDVVSRPKIECDSSCDISSVEDITIDGQAYEISQDEKKAIESISRMSRSKNKITFLNKPISSDFWENGREYKINAKVNCLNGRSTTISSVIAVDKHEIIEVGELLAERSASAESVNQRKGPVPDFQSLIEEAEAAESNEEISQCQFRARLVIPYFDNPGNGYDLIDDAGFVPAGYKENYYNYFTKEKVEEIYSNAIDQYGDFSDFKIVAGTEGPALVEMESPPQTPYCIEWRDCWNEDGFAKLYFDDGAYFGVGAHKQNGAEGFANWITEYREELGVESEKEIMVILVDALITGRGNMASYYSNGTDLIRSIRSGLYDPDFRVVTVAVTNPLPENFEVYDPDMEVDDFEVDFDQGGKDPNEMFFNPEFMEQRGRDLAHEIGHAMTLFHYGHYEPGGWDENHPNLMSYVGGEGDDSLTADQACLVRVMCHNPWRIGIPYGFNDFDPGHPVFDLGTSETICGGEGFKSNPYPADDNMYEECEIYFSTAEFDSKDLDDAKNWQGSPFQLNCEEDNPIENWKYDAYYGSEDESRRTPYYCYEKLPEGHPDRIPDTNHRPNLCRKVSFCGNDYFDGSEIEECEWDYDGDEDHTPDEGYCPESMPACLMEGNIPFGKNCICGPGEVHSECVIDAGVPVCVIVPGEGEDACFTAADCLPDGGGISNPTGDDGGGDSGGGPDIEDEEGLTCDDYSCQDVCNNKYKEIECVSTTPSDPGHEDQVDCCIKSNCKENNPDEFLIQEGPTCFLVCEEDFLNGGDFCPADVPDDPGEPPTE